MIVGRNCQSQSVAFDVDVPKSSIVPFAAFRHDALLDHPTSPRAALPTRRPHSHRANLLPRWASYLEGSGRPSLVVDRALPSRTNALDMSPRRPLRDSFPRSTRSSLPTARRLSARSISNVLPERPCRYGRSAARRTPPETRPTWEAGTSNFLHSIRSVPGVSRPGSFTSPRLTRNRRQSRVSTGSSWTS
jgi:hypothetical protein